MQNLRTDLQSKRQPTLPTQQLPAIEHMDSEWPMKSRVPLWFVSTAEATARSGVDPLIQRRNPGRHGAIVVTANYRLGSLSFFSHPELTDGVSASRIRELRVSGSDTGVAVGYSRTSPDSAAIRVRIVNDVAESAGAAT